MKVGFVNQNISPRLNIGLTYIMTVVKSEYDILFWDAVGKAADVFENLILNDIKKHRPSVVCFSVNTYTFDSSLKIARVIRKYYPEMILLFGGVHPTILPDECLREPLVDIICLGEGEYSIPEALSSIEHGKMPYNVDGIWFKDGRERIVRNPLRPFVPDLDKLPFPDWDIWDMDLYLSSGGLMRNSLKVLSSRGCYHECRFCTAPTIMKRIPGQFHRLRSPQKVIEEIELNYRKYESRGLQFNSFADPLFGADKDHFQELMHLYRSSGLSDRLPWVCETRPELLTDQWVKTAKESGCMVVSLGVEAGSSGRRKSVFGKAVGNETVNEAIKNLKKYDVMMIFYLMLCGPGETLQSLMRTLLLPIRFNPIKTYFLFFLPLPETPLFSECKGAEIKHKDTVHDDGHWNRPNIKIPGFGVLKSAMMWAMIITVKVWMFLITGIKKRGVYFLIDIIRYLCGRNRVLSLRNPYSQNEVYQNTVLKYYFEDFLNHRKKGANDE